MGERLRRYTDHMIAEDPDGFLSSLEKFVRAMRPVLTKRQHAQNLIVLARWQNIADRPRDALVVLDDAVPLARRVDREGDVLARALATQAVCLWRIADNEGAIDVATEAIRLLEPLAVARPGRYGSALRQATWALGMAYYDSDQLAAAVPAFEQVIRLARVTPELNPWEEINKLAIALFDLDRAADALPHVVEVVRLLRPLAADDPATYEPELAKALEFEVECQMYVGRWGSAEREAAAESAAILRRLVAAGQDQYQERLATVLFYLGQMSGDEVTHFLEAIGILRQLGDDETPFFAQLLYLSMRPLIDIGRVEEARTAGTEAATLYRKLAETDHHYVEMTARVLQLLGDVGEPAERLANLEEAVRTWRVAGTSEWSVFLSVLAKMLITTATCLEENGRDGSAAAEEAVALYRELVEDAPDEVSAYWYATDLAGAEAVLLRLSG